MPSDFQLNKYPPHIPPYTQRETDEVGRQNSLFLSVRMSHTEEGHSTFLWAVTPPDPQYKLRGK